MVCSINLLQWNLTIAAAAIVVALGFLGCEKEVYLQSNVVDPAKIINSSIADMKFNVVRFETFGPQQEQIYGYVLHQDDADVRTNSAPLARLGKMSPREVLDDYEKTRRVKGWYRASSPVIREVRRGGSLIALTASDYMLDVHLWEDKAQGEKENKIIIILTYEDRRPTDKM